ncbi:MAG: hypothetical protein HY659_14475 [Rhizobiales bacterium]|nr:hypothetical protein [Hyphomicrobiales bacterium]
MKIRGVPYYVFPAMMKRVTFLIGKIDVPAKRRLTLGEKRVVDSYVERV